MALKDRLLRRRTSLGLTRKDVADLSDLTERTLVNYEEGSREPKASDLQKIAKALQTTAAYLLGEVEDPNLLADRFQKLREEFSDVDSEKVEKVINTPSQGYVLDRLIPEGMTDEELEDVIKRNEILVKRLELEYLRREQEKRKK